MTDIERKENHGKWAAMQIFDYLGVLDKHDQFIKMMVEFHAGNTKKYIREVHERYKDVPEYQERIKELMLDHKLKAVLSD